MNKQPSVGDTRTFEFNDKTYEIIQILENTGTKMDFLHGRQICPYCNREFGNRKTHIFNRIEVLIPQPTAKYKEEKDIVLLGFSDDKRVIMVTPKLNELRDKIEGLKDK